MPNFRVPIAVRSGAPSTLVPEPAYVWHAVQPVLSKSSAPGTALFGSCSSLIQRCTELSDVLET